MAKMPLGPKATRFDIGDLGVLHNSFGWSKFLEDGLDKYFMARRVENFGAFREVPVQASSFWRQTVNDATGAGEMAGEILNEANYISTAIYSRRAFEYGHLNAHITLPDLSPASVPNNSGLFFGFENDAIGGTGIGSFYWVKSDGRVGWPAAGTEAMFIYLGSGMWTAVGATPWNLLDITALMPANIKTTHHIWDVELTENLAVFYLDGNPVAYGILNNGGAQFTSIAGPPYGFVSCNRPFSTSLPSLLEIYGIGNRITANVSPYGWRLSEGSPRPPRVVRLFRSGVNTLMAGTVLAAGNQVSHPTPTFGFPHKTLNVHCSQDVAVLLEALMHTNNWRTYDSFNVPANTLKHYVIEGQVTLLRATVTPAAFPCTINDAEAILA